ncbi:HNH endonuclease family protein [Streptomyces celluloflavus]|uniref:HNH endonuclease family protein n=1 Tax=Streptomyces noursei TaxID=1971 RepID=UPI00099C1D65|nr:HNH endonuclease family protein [Streptomyces noursei]
MAHPAALGLVGLSTLALALPAPVYRAAAGLPSVATAPLPSKQVVLQQLNSLTVRPKGNPPQVYDRQRFGGWIKDPKTQCTIPVVLLARDKFSGKFLQNECKIENGVWLDRYAGMVLNYQGRKIPPMDWVISKTKKVKLDIDHVVPLKDAWASGAWQWDDAKREKFANDLARPQLLAVSSNPNRAKGQKYPGPGKEGGQPKTWWPTATYYRCPYLKQWVAVKTYYKLSVLQAEKDNIIEGLKKCT